MLTLILVIGFGLFIVKLVLLCRIPAATSKAVVQTADAEPLPSRMEQERIFAIEWERKWATTMGLPMPQCVLDFDTKQKTKTELTAKKREEEMARTTQRTIPPMRGEQQPTGRAKPKPNIGPPPRPAPPKRELFGTVNEMTRRLEELTDQSNAMILESQRMNKEIADAAHRELAIAGKKVGLDLVQQPYGGRATNDYDSEITETPSQRSARYKWYAAENCPYIYDTYRPYKVHNFKH